MHGDETSRDDPSRPRRPGAAAAAQIGLPFALVLYLALRGAGYDHVVWGGAGVAIWWLVVLGSVVGLWPRGRISRGAVIAATLAALFTLWTVLALLWTDSSERTIVEAARVGTYLGVLVLGILVAGPDSARRTITGVGAAIGLVAVLAALSRFEPGLFPENEIPAFLPEATARLSYPLDYWNGLAALLAIGAPLALHMGVSSRRPLAAGLWTAALPVIAIVMYMTLSRGGGLELAVAILVYLAIRGERLAVVPFLAVAAIPSAALIWLLERRDALADGLTTAAAESQGDEMLGFSILAVALTAVGAGLIAHLRARGRLAIPVASQRTTRRFAVVLAATAAAALIAAAATGYTDDRWDSFKSTDIAGDSSERLSSASGNGRYQFWDSSLEANSTDPLTGIGPGTWEYWWAENGTISAFVRDAHGLYFEVIAEGGIIGLAILLGFLGWIGVVGTAQALAASLARRADQAALLGAAAAFLVAAGIDWAWEQPVIPATFMLIAAAAIGPVIRQGQVPGAERVSSARPRIALAVGGAVVTAALAVPYLAAERLQASHERAGSGDLQGALDAALDAESLQPSWASPRLQQALVLEEAGLYADAVEPAREATEREPTNWRTWFVLARIETQAGFDAPAARHKSRARRLNPRSPLFANAG